MKCSFQSKTVRRTIQSLLLLFGQNLMAQSQATYPIITPSNITTFTTEEGLPICTHNVFTAPDGRLYISTCEPEAIDDNFQLYEYDGHTLTKLPFHDLLGNSRAFPFFEGINEQGSLWGHFNPNENGALLASVFLFHPQNAELEVYSLAERIGPEGVVKKIHHDAKYGFLVFATDEINNYLFQWEDASFQLLTSIPKLGGSTFKSYHAQALLTRQSDAIWFWERESNSLWKYDLSKDTAKRYSRKDFSDFRSDNPYLQLNGLVGIEDGNLVISFNNETDPPTYIYDPSKDHFELLTGKEEWNTGYSEYIDALFLDETGNLLILRDRDTKDPAWWLLEKETGKIYDYSLVIKEALQDLPPSRRTIAQITGKDFRKKMLITANGGVSWGEIGSKESMQRYEVGGTRAMVELDTGQVLAKTEGSGYFLVLDRLRKTLTPVKQTSHSCIMTKTDYHHLANYLPDMEGNILLPLEDSSLIRYNPETNACESLEVGIPFLRFVPLNDHLLALVHSSTSELFYFDLKTQQLSPVMHGDSTVRFGSQVLQLKQLSDGLLYVGTNNGLWSVDLRTGKMDRPHPNLPFNKDQVYAIDEASNGKLWLGTGNGGVQIYNPQTGQLQIIDESSGLSNNKVISILQDKEGVRWVNTYNGLNLLDTNGTFLTKIYQEDGLIEDEGNRFSSLKTRDGKLLFGFISGITEIDPERTKAQLLSGEKLKIFLTQLSYFDKSLKKDTFQTLGLNAALSLNLPATHRYLKLRLALSDFQRIEENTFSYRLEGLKKGEEPEWTFIGNQPELNLTNLPPGEYDLVIRGTNYRAQKTVTPVRIKLRVQEFFYKKTWFYILVFLLLSALPILWLIRERFERQRLQRLVKERTKEIETDKKVIEAQAERLQALDQSKSRFFTNISHEFRTPLTVISGMVAQFKGNDRAKQLVQRNTDQLLQLINQILDLRKLESSRLPTHYIQADVVSYLRYITESFHSLSTNKAVKISFHTTEESMLLDYDPDKLLRIVSNLLSNAIKFTPAGGSVTVAVEVQKDSMPLQYRFSVRDTGVGIPVNKLPHIFDRFYQVDDSITRSGEGTGIGLTLTKELVELMNGKIQVESQEAKGSTFTVILPLTQEAALEENRQLAKAAIPVMPDFPTSDLLQAERIGDEDLPRLLLVEDNPDVMAYLVACLEGEYQLSLAFDGQEGIDKALEEIPDIIISDVMMPKRDGFDLCNSLKTEKRTSHIPIILLTAKADADSRITGLERGANAYLAKPFVQRELKAQVRNLFALRQSLQARYADLESLEPSKEPEVEQEDIFVLNVKALVLKNLDDLDYDLNALSKALNLSRSQLGRKLKALTGNSPGIFIRNIRLHEAKRLLLTTDRSVKEIAYDVGFSSHNYFTNSYTAAFNESPSDTRQSGKTRT